MTTKKKAYLALATVCLLWGTSYLTMKIGVTTIPPFLFSAVRQLSAGIILFMALPLFKINYSFQWKDIGKQLIPAVLMIVLGNAVIGWAEQYIPSGLAALIVSAMPLYVTLLNFLVVHESRDINKQIVSGLVLGSIGIILIFRDNLADLANPIYHYGILATFGAALCWAAGTVYMKTTSFRTGAFVNAAFQFTIGGIVLAIASPFLDDYSRLHEATDESIWSLVYLIFFGSIIPYMCYLYAIENLKVGLVSVYAYINPFIAIILGMAILDERVTWITGLAFMATIGGVYCINRGHNNNLHKKMTNEKWFDRTFDFSIGSEEFPALLNRLKAAPQAYRDAIAGLSEKALTDKPKGKWSVNENIGHLLVLEKLWLKRLREIAGGAAQMSRTDLDNKATDEAEFNNLPANVILEQFKDERAQTITFLESISEKDLQKVSFHPRLEINMRIIDKMLFIAEHDDHHLAAIDHLNTL